MKLSASVLTIGNELLSGSVLDTNSCYVSKELSKIGIPVKHQYSCEDSIPAIEETLGHALSQSEVIIMSGGLGPTPDDVTRDAIAHFFKVPLVFSKKQYQRIEQYFKKRHKKVPALTKKESYYPENAKPLINKHGIALGFYIPCGGRVIIVLPGVPKELERMMEELVLPLLKKNFKNARPRPKLIVKTLGLSESSVMEKLGKSFFKTRMDFGIYPNYGEVALRIYSDSQKNISSIKRDVKKKLASHIYAYDELTLAESLGKKLKKTMSLSVAESCTGGLLAASLTSNPGSSVYFKGGALVYSNEAKVKLGVKPGTLKKHGAVSKQVAHELADAVREQMGSKYGLSITGIAGPGGGTKAKPIGLTFIGLSTPKKTVVEKHYFWGLREQVRQKAVIKAMEMIWKTIHAKS